MNQIHYASSQMTAIQREYASSDADCTEDADYIYYEDLSNQLETEKESIDSQINSYRKRNFRLENTCKQIISNQAVL